MGKPHKIIRVSKILSAYLYLEIEVKQLTVTDICKKEYTLSCAFFKQA